MANPQLLEYIHTQTAAGVSKEDISKALLAGGWKAEDIGEAFMSIENRPLVRPPAMPVSPTPVVPESVVITPDHTASAPAPVQPTTAPAEAPMASAPVVPVQSPVVQAPVAVASPVAAGSPVPQKLKGVFHLIGESCSLVAKRFVTILLLELVNIFFLLLMAGAIAVGALFSHGGYIVIAIAIIAVVLAMILIFRNGAAVLAAITNEQAIGVRDSYRASHGKALGLFWVSIVAGFVVMGGLILLILPLFIFMTWFMFAPFVYFTEGDRGMSALLKSKEYVRGRFWAVFGRLAGAIGILIVVSIGLALLQALLTAGLVAFGGVISLAVSLIVGTLLRFVVGFVFYAYIYLLYKDVKATKGAFTFAPSTGAKVLFYCIGGILGLVCLFALPFAIVFTSLNTARTHARDAERISDIQQIQLQLELHVVDAYPATLDALAADPSVPPMPVDPSTHMPYDYTPNSTDTAYTLCTTLESTPVPKCVEGSITPPSQATSTPVLR